MSSERTYACDCGQQVTFREMTAGDHRKCIVSMAQREIKEEEQDEQDIRAEIADVPVTPAPRDEVRAAPSRTPELADGKWATAWMISGLLVRCALWFITWMGCCGMSYVFLASNASIGLGPALFIVGYILATGTVVSLLSDRMVKAFFAQQVEKAWFK